MTSHPSPSRLEQCTPVNWLVLPADVCASILRRLHVVDILTSVQYVCSKWRRICRDPSMWRSINFVPSDDDSIDLSRLYRFAVDLSSGGLVDVNLDYNDYKVLLPYISDRSKHLRRIRLGGSSDLSDVKFFEMADKFAAVEELDIAKSNCCYDFSSESVATLSRLCPSLYSFKVNVLSDDVAFAIGKNMCGLRHLQISGSLVDKNGLLAILDGCQHLESLDLSPCFLNLDEGLKIRCSEQIKDFHGPQDYDLDSLFEEDFFGPDEEILGIASAIESISDGSE